MSYAIMRFAKRKRGSINSMEAHNERKKEKYKSNPDIEVNRSNDNYHIVQPHHKYYAEIMYRVEQAECKVRKDSVLMVETLITASPEFMHALPAEEQREYFERAVAFIKQEVGEKNVFAATIHMDEKTPHMHICFTPITEDNRLSAKRVLGNQQKLSEWQSKFHCHMSGRWTELERGVSAMESHRKHIPVWLYKKAQRMDREAEDIKQALADINAFNAGKKRDAALTSLVEWLPEAQKFTAQVKNTQGYIAQLEGNNLALQGKLQGKNEKYEDLLTEAVYLKHTVKCQQRLLDKVPKNVLEQIENSKFKVRER